MRSKVTAQSDVPAEYRQVSMLDLKEDRRSAATVQLSFVLAVAAMVAVAVFLDLPLDSGWSTWAVAAVTVGACLTYMVLHELTHGLLLLLLTGVRPTFAVRVPYLVTGSQALLTRKQALAVALAPLAVWGAVLLILLLALPTELFLTVYVVMALNLAGSAGDVVQAVAFRRLPREALIRDDGSQTSVFLIPAD